ncbi:unnamed protein product [Cylindrotheca closterium]|uniref:Uncharacterized protein n=1 Tax=Cylindrotheca closterium TaxID=2856 RepID=A0AAD2CH69_9STRA|nr:unnamed protein product [Cylindrotheca closterium]
MNKATKKAMGFLLNPLHSLHLRGGAVRVEGMIMSNTPKKSFTIRLGGIFRSCRKGCQVEVCDSPSADETSTLKLEGLEILRNIALLKDGMDKMTDAECDSHVAIVYQSWARLQIQALYKRLDEIKEEVEQEVIYR